ncbi:hypothetical protein [Enterococcus faecium]|uniref:hypothetical protein n=1 Tax=Enterococcus faecium TaxID=1352 RepID=UPI000CF335E1|nr:hypothetical protein [Enterococcus faecium]PQG95728.1 hypothetical protein CUS55_04255 [Enterococcus faecium]RBS34358.1 hypothetical protein EB14_00678 [Enterococcus faecium]
MKLKDGFYASNHGIGGLMLDMPTKNPKTREKPKFNTKLVGMLACSSNTGLTFSIENGADEVAALELEAKVMQDEFGKFYHEAIVAELEEDLTDNWMTKLTADVIKKTTTTTTTTTTTP